MQLHCLGISHNTAPLALREKLALSEEQTRSVLSRFSCGHINITSDIAELVIVSTCNRLEMYAVSSHPVFMELETMLCDVHSIAPSDFAGHAYRHTGMEVVRHLFNVAAGLDSLVVGEPQILGQISRALELSRGQNATGQILNRLFQAAIHAGKRARTETDISRNPASVSSLAASVAEKTIGHIEAASVAVLGAGEMAELTVEALRKRGVEKITVVNRTLERARALAQRWGAASATFESIQSILGVTDIVISSTGAPHILLTKEMVAAAVQSRAQRPLMLVDIAVPRDIDPDAAQFDGVTLFDMDSLNAQLEDSLAHRMNEVPHVKAILAQEVSDFESYLKSTEMLPIISDIRQNAESIRTKELEKTLRRMPDLTEEERQRIEAMTLSLVKKLLDQPTRRLRAESLCPHAPEYATVARTLFGLEHETGLCDFSGGACPISTAAD